MSTAARFKFRSDSLAGRCIAFLQANPDEELDIDAIAAKFDAPTGNIHTKLSQAVECGALVRDRNADGDYIYKLADAASTPTSNSKGFVLAHISPGMANAPAAAPLRTRTVNLIDLTALKVDDNVPFMPTQRGKGKWDAMFDKLTKPGQSIEFPATVQPAVMVAASKYAKEHGVKFSFARTGETTSRIWRIK